MQLLIQLLEKKTFLMLAWQGGSLDASSLGEFDYFKGSHGIAYTWGWLSMSFHTAGEVSQLFF